MARFLVTSEGRLDEMNGLWRPVADISLFLPAMMIGAEGRAVWGSLVRPRGVQPSWNALSMEAEEKREAKELNEM